MQAVQADLTRSVHASNYDGMICAESPRDFFAGIVCMQD